VSWQWGEAVAGHRAVANGGCDGLLLAQAGGQLLLEEGGMAWWGIA
jgi:hypothetical protein